MREFGLAMWISLAFLSGCHEGARAYPSGPYGDTTGEVVPPSLVWVGYREAGQVPAAILITDYYDADGSKGIDALLVDQSAAWCAPCRKMANGLHRAMSELRPHGVQVLMLITESPDHLPATAETARLWRDQFGGDGVVVAADPSYSFRETVGARLAPLPFRVLVDPRSMRVTDVDVGVTDDFSSVIALAQKNQK